MGKFEQAGKVGLREKMSKKLIAIYPFPVKGSGTKGTGYLSQF